MSHGNDERKSLRALDKLNEGCPTKNIEMIRQAITRLKDNLFLLAYSDAEKVLLISSNVLESIAYDSNQLLVKILCYLIQCIGCVRMNYRQGAVNQMKQISRDAASLIAEGDIDCEVEGKSPLDTMKDIVSHLASDSDQILPNPCANKEYSLLVEAIVAVRHEMKEIEEPSLSPVNTGVFTKVGDGRRGQVTEQMLTQSLVLSSSLLPCRPRGLGRFAKESQSLHDYVLHTLTQLRTDRCSAPAVDGEVSTTQSALVHPQHFSDALTVIAESQNENDQSTPPSLKLIASRDIAKGELILCEEPLISFSSACVGQHPAVRDECAHCWKSLSYRRKKYGAEGLIYCNKGGRATDSTNGGCGELYCSMTCRDTAWSTYHCILCCDSGSSSGSGWRDFLEAMNFSQSFSAFPSTMCLTVKLLSALHSRRMNAGGDTMNNTLFSPWSEVDILCSKLDASCLSVNGGDCNMIEKVRDSTAEKIILIYDLIKTHMPHLVYPQGDSKESVIDIEKLVSAYCTLAHNAMGEGDTANALHRAALFCFASFANHSCDPTATFSFMSGRHRIAFASRKPIKQGEEITISYLSDSERGFEKRRKSLLVSYGFICECSLCCEGKDVVSSEEEESDDDSSDVF